MSVNLSKGETLNLTKATPALTSIFFGAGWDMKGGKAVDLDLSVFALDANGKCRSKDDMIYYGHKSNTAGSILSSGDNLTGEGEGDDEVVTVKLDQLPADIKEVVAVITRYDGGGVVLGEVDNAFCRIVDQVSTKELAKTEVKGNPADSKSLTFMRVVREADGWHAHAVNEFGTADLGGLSNKYGL